MHFLKIFLRLEFFTSIEGNAFIWNTFVLKAFYAILLHDLTFFEYVFEDFSPFLIRFNLHLHTRCIASKEVHFCNLKNI